MSTGFEVPSLEELLDECERTLEYRFRDRNLLRRCLTHASVARTRLESNERLEFLGDAVLGAVVCDMLYRRFPTFPEGELTRIKSAVVSRNTCAAVSDRLGLERYLLLGKGLDSGSPAGVPRSILAAVFESLIAGVHLDGGYAAAVSLIERLLSEVVEAAAEANHLRNYKSMLQQHSQKRHGETPMYRLLDEKGPDHAKCFQVSAAIGTRVFSAAWGPNKKEAEQRAARNALVELQADEVLPIGE